MSAYAKDLTWELETSFVSDEEIRRALRRVRQVEADGDDPNVKLGSPKQYAQTFRPSDHKKRNYHVIINGGGVLMVAWLIGIVTLVKTGHVTLPTNFIIPGTALAILVLSLTISFGLTWIRARRFV